MSTRRFGVLAVMIVCLGGVAAAQEQPEIQNWTAPPYWTPPAVVKEGGPDVEMQASAQGLGPITAYGTLPSAPLPFIAVTPCRIVDTRGAVGTFGGPALAAGVPRNFPLPTGPCAGVPTTAGAYSLNITVTNTLGGGFILIYPQGGAQPAVSTLNYSAGQTVANAAIVPAGTAGGITVVAGVSGTDLIVDINGYYGPHSVVTSLTGGASTLTGDVTLAAGSNVTITPSGQTLTIAGPTALPPNGAAGGDLTGTYPSPSLAASGVTAAAYGASGANVPSITVDAKGRLTAASNRALTPANIGASATSHTHWGQSWTGSGTGLTLSGGNMGVFGTGSSSGVQGNSTSGIGVYGGSSGGIGVEGDSTSGWGVYGSSTSDHGVYGFSSSSSAVYGQSTNGAGVEGISTGNHGVVGSSASFYGVYGNSTTGYGVYGFSSSNYGVYGAGTTGVYGAGTNYGVYGFSSSNYGVYGSGTTRGVYGSSTNGIGVYGSSTNGYGVYGNSSNSYAGYFTGTAYVGGLLTKAGGGFKIDHPLDPANKYLYHSFVESPDMKNIYDGVVTTDAQGRAVVELPAWFEALNRDFRYQLTVIGRFAQPIVEQEIEGNRFVIRTNLANIKVSWQVTGIRQDPWANAHRLPVEEVKPGAEDGSYLHPELYGQSEDKSVEWAMNPEAMRRMKAEREKAASPQK